MGILRKTVLVGALALALPTPPENNKADGVVAQNPSSLAYVSAAAQTLADVQTFCARQPGVCSAAGHIALKMEAKAKYSAKLLYEWANEASQPTAAISAANLDLAGTDKISTGSLGRESALPQSQSTRRIEDLILSWEALPEAHLVGTGVRGHRKG